MLGFLFYLRMRNFITKNAQFNDKKEQKSSLIPNVTGERTKNYYKINPNVCSW